VAVAGENGRSTVSGVLRKAGIEQIKRVSGLPFRADVKRLERLGERDFWQHQEAALLRRYADARTHVPYYGDAAAGYPESLVATGDVVETLKALPILEKSVVKARTEDFWRRPYFLGSATDTTGGTTGGPLRYRAAFYELGYTNAILEQRYLRITGTRTPRILRLTGFLHGSAEKDLWARIPGTSVAYLSIYHLHRDFRDDVSDRLRRFRPQLIHGYPSAIAQLAKLYADTGLPVSSLRAVTSTSETLYPEQRDVIEQALRTHVYNDYGSMEGQHLALECDHRSMHIHPARGIVELLKLDSEEPAQPGELGRVVVTGLLARSMPLFRYDLGDTAEATGYRADCRCGSRWPTIGRVYGRLEDLVKTRDGRRVGMISVSTLEKFDGILESQIVQRDYGSFVYRIKPDKTLNLEDFERHVVADLRSRLQEDVSVKFEYVDSVGRTARGKLRSVVVQF
jgi:phenylacetate-CoA ligase